MQFQVSETWKGTTAGRVTARTADNEAACGYGFRTGVEYLVYADPGGDQLQVSLCSRTVPVAQAGADLGALGPGTVAQQATATPAGPAAIDPQPFPRRLAYVAAALVVAVLALGGALIIWRMGPGPQDDEAG